MQYDRSNSRKLPTKWSWNTHELHMTRNYMTCYQVERPMLTHALSVRFLMHVLFDGYIAIHVWERFSISYFLTVTAYEYHVVSNHQLFECSFNIFSCDQAALWMVFSVRLSVCLSVCLSVRLSVCHTFLTMFPSSYHHEIFRSYHIGPG